MSSRASRCLSSSATCRETADTEASRRSAARAKLPASTTVTNALIAWNLSIGTLLHIEQQSINKMNVYPDMRN